MLARYYGTFAKLVFIISVRRRVSLSHGMLAHGLYHHQTRIISHCANVCLYFAPFQQHATHACHKRTHTHYDTITAHKSATRE